MSRRKELYCMEPNPIGIGGQADVFKATEKKTGEIVALKRIRSNHDKDAIARMKREIKVQTEVLHPNIMPILEHSYNYFWYSMPLAIKNAKQLNPPVDNKVLLTLVQCVAKGLMAAHKKGFIHRDVKPSNILLLNEDKEQWVISDWGLVRTHGQTTEIRTEVGVHFGTPGYAAPELWVDAHNSDERADVYGLGRVVAWCITGEILPPNIPIIPNGIWKEFVERTTEQRQNKRTKNMLEVLNLLEPIEYQLNYDSKKENRREFTPIKITRIIEEDITVPPNDGTRGSGLYLIPFELSRKPSAEWVDKFIDTWNDPPKFTTMHRRGIARVSYDKIILDGTTIEEVKKYHKDTLSLAIEAANAHCEKIQEQERKMQLEREKRITEHRENIGELIDDIEFD